MIKTYIRPRALLIAGEIMSDIRRGSLHEFQAKSEAAAIELRRLHKINKILIKHLEIIKNASPNSYIHSEADFALRTAKGDAYADQ